MSKIPNKEELQLRKQYTEETSKNPMAGKKQSKGYTKWKKELREMKEENEAEENEINEIIEDVIEESEEELTEEEVEEVESVEGEAIDEVKAKKDEEKIAKAEKEMARLDRLKSQLGNFKESVVDLQAILPDESEFEFKAEKVHRLGRAIRLLQIIDKRFDELIGVMDEWMDRRIEIQLKNKQRRILKEKTK